MSTLRAFTVRLQSIGPSLRETTSVFECFWRFLVASGERPAEVATITLNASGSMLDSSNDCFLVSQFGGFAVTVDSTENHN